MEFEKGSLLANSASHTWISEKNIKSCVCEAIGTFFLCTTIALVAGQEGGTAITSFASDAPLAPLAIGLTLMVMIYSFGHISGAHFNPAVTLGVFLRGKIDAHLAWFYVLSQVVGSFIAGAVTSAVANDAGFKCGYPSVNPSITTFTAIILEAIYTFALVIVVLNSATTKKQSGNSFFGLAIGMTVASAAWSVGALSGGAFNPAVGTGLPVMSGDYDDVWIYWVGPCLGAFCAANMFKFTVDASELDD
jgi:aquaporin Z